MKGGYLELGAARSSLPVLYTLLSRGCPTTVAPIEENKGLPRTEAPAKWVRFGASLQYLSLRRE